MAVDAFPESPGPDAEPFSPAPYTVVDRVAETADTVTLRLRPARPTEHGREFRPGQFNMLYRFGLGEVAISISGDPSAPGELVHTIRAAGKISAALTKARPGETIGVRGPYGAGWPVDRASHGDLLIVAGGLGLPPLRPALYSVLADRSRFERVEVVYGARSPADLVYYAELQRWRQRTDLRCQVTVDAAGRDWYGDVGLVTARLPDTRLDAARTTAFLCGPEIMMRLTAQALERMGVPDTAIWLSMERNMKCAVGLCGHCQYGPAFVCRDGPVFCYRDIKARLTMREI